MSNETASKDPDIFTVLTRLTEACREARQKLIAQGRQQDVQDADRRLDAVLTKGEDELRATLTAKLGAPLMPVAEVALTGLSMVSRLVLGLGPDPRASERMYRDLNKDEEPK